MSLDALGKKNFREVVNIYCLKDRLQSRLLPLDRCLSITMEEKKNPTNAIFDMRRKAGFPEKCGDAVFI